MKELDFLNRLKKEKKIRLLESNSELKNSYLEKSKSNLIAAKILLANNRFEESVSLSYYSMYHSLSALLYLVGIKSENHSASIIILKEIFSIDNSKLLFAKKERVDKQYYTSFFISKEDVKEMITIAENFNNLILEFFSNLKTEQIKFYRNKFISLLKFKKI